MIGLLTEGEIDFYALFIEVTIELKICISNLSCVNYG